MDLEELVDDDTAPSRISALVWVVVVAIGLAIGSVVVGHGPSGPVATTAVVEQTPVVKPVPLPNVPTLIGLGHNLVLGYTCPGFTVGGETLAVSFQLVNFGQQDVTLLSINPKLPKRGLTVAGGPTMGGACSEPGNDPPGGLLGPGDSRLITLRFARPAVCSPAAAKPQHLDISVQQMVGATTTATKSDLGLLSFSVCPSA